jgi:hypothetical protein
VLRAQLVAAAPRRPDHDRDGDAAAEHVVNVRGSVHDLVEGDEHEVDRHHLRHRAQPGHGGADGGADDHLFGNGCVQHPLFTEFFHQPTGDLEGPVVEPDVLAEEEDVLVAFHLLPERLVESVAHGGNSHQEAAPLA